MRVIMSLAPSLGILMALFFFIHLLMTFQVAEQATAVPLSATQHTPAAAGSSSQLNFAALQHSLNSVTLPKTQVPTAAPRRRQTDAAFARHFFQFPPAQSSVAASYSYNAAQENDVAAALRATFPPTGEEAGPLPRPVCQANSDLFQRFLQAKQFPSDCRTVPILLRRRMEPPTHGFYDGLRYANHMQHATLAGRVYIDASENAYLSDICPSKNLECLFRPITSCSMRDIDEEEICYEPSCFATARVVSFDQLRQPSATDAETNKYAHCEDT
jgi:hypothetical protein